MNNFEGLPAEKLPEIQVGDRPSIEQEGRSYFDATYDALVSKLEANGDAVLGDFVVALPAKTKEQLAAALNAAGRDRNYLGTIDKESSQEVVDKITAWKDERELANDSQAIRNVNLSLVNFLEEA